MTRRLSIGVLIGLVSLGAFALWQRRLRPPLAGDEPSYLVQAESLWFDHDIDLSNNYGANARIDSQLATPIVPRPSMLRRSSGALLPVQPIGMGVLLTPAVAIGHRGAAEVLWARRLMMLLAALLTWQLFELLADHVGLGFSTAVTAGIVLSLPMVAFSNQVYPEIPAALLLTVGLRAVLGPSGARVLLAGSVAAPLPWLSLRFLPLAVGLVAAAIWRTSGTRIDWSWRRIVAAGGPLAAGIVLLAAIDVETFNAPTPVVQSLMNTYRIGVGGLFSPVYGILPFAPQLALGIAGIGLIALATRSAIAIIVGVLAYEFVGSPFGFRGYALPGRFQIVLVPVLALAIGLLLAAYPRVALVFVAAAAIGVIVLREGGRQPTYGALYQDGARPTVPVLRAVAPVLPDFSLAPGHTGAVIRGSEFGASSPAAAAGAVSPEVALRRGRYEVVFAVRTTGAAEVTATVDGSERAADAPARVTSVEQRVDGAATLRARLRVDRSGARYRFGVVSTSPSIAARPGTLTVRPVSRLESRTAPSRRDLPLGLGWMLAATASAAGVVAAARRSRVNASDYRHTGLDPMNGVSETEPSDE
ncbi:MAG: hypothetical protein QOH10_682 [Actinomycetota bacterium]|nr:hypothetical protein [Actinomycetota bacterium]